MKRTLLLAALFVLLGAGAWYAIVQNKQKTSVKTSWDMDFGVTDPSIISKIFIADRTGQTATLERKDGYWLYNGKAKARPTAIQTLLETIAQVRVEFAPTETAKPHLIKALAGEGIKVELYNKSNELFKCYYVGDVTTDERGTYMIMDKSENPYVVQVPSFIGQIRVRYLLGDDNWMDRSVFSEKPEEINSVSVEYPQQKSQSFRVLKNEDGGYTVTPFYSTTTPIKAPLRKGVPEAFLLQFERLTAEGFETTNPVRDSVENLVPFAIVTVQNQKGTETKAKFWPLEVERDPTTGQIFVVRYFTDVNNGSQFMLTQHHVFGPIFRGYPFFFDVSKASGQ
ncbi:MAG: DUF4340 domain-containing protein [Bacteroidetes bacterium]|nr:DUF4340 domain-containing protein [Bacteroidota bacterium]